MTSNRLWYAVQMSPDDDWGTGSFDFDEAVEMAQSIGAQLIAVIENGECTREVWLGEA